MTLIRHFFTVTQQNLYHNYEEVKKELIETNIFTVLKDDGAALIVI